MLMCFFTFNFYSLCEIIWENFINFKEKSYYMKKISTPISDDVINDLKVGDKISLSGIMYCGRDAVLPKLVE